MQTISEYGFTKKQAKLAIENIEYLDTQQAIEWIINNPELGTSPDKLESQ